MKATMNWMMAVILLLGAIPVLYAQPTGITLPKVCIDNQKGININTNKKILIK